jgi:hypothetical protein
LLIGGVVFFIQRFDIQWVAGKPEVVPRKDGSHLLVAMRLPEIDAIRRAMAVVRGPNASADPAVISAFVETLSLRLGAPPRQIMWLAIDEAARVEWIRFGWRNRRPVDFYRQPLRHPLHPKDGRRALCAYFPQASGLLGVMDSQLPSLRSTQG